MNEQHLSTELLIDYLHGELEAGEDVRVLAHIESCASCRETYQTEARLTDALRAYRAAERELPAGVVATIWDRVELESRPVWQSRLAWLLRPALMLPTAAALVIATFFGVSNMHNSGARTSIDAAYYLDDHAALTKTVPFDEASASVVPASLESDDPEADQRWVATADTSTTNDSP